jgi:hypothetical protein
VNLKLFLSPDWRLKEESLSTNEWQVDFEGPIVTYNIFIGSINSDSNLIIEFEPTKTTGLPEKVPFQFQLAYTRCDDGSKIICVISRHIPITYSRDVAESNVDMEAIGLNAIRRVATTAQKGLYTLARLQNFALLQLMKRVVKAAKNKDEAQDVLNSYLVHNHKFEKHMQTIILREIKQGKQWDESDDVLEAPPTNFFDSITSFFGLGNNTNNEPEEKGPVFTNNVYREKIVESRKTYLKDDAFSNLLWNFRSANML